MGRPLIMISMYKAGSIVRISPRTYHFIDLRFVVLDERFIDTLTDQRLSDRLCGTIEERRAQCQLRVSDVRGTPCLH